MSSSRAAPEPVAPYVARPPDWLKRAHATADLGYSGFFPPLPHAKEEQLNEQTAQHGFTSQPEVAAENFNAKSEVSKAFRTGTALEDLKQLMEAVIERRADNAAKLPPSSFKIPGRVTFNEQRRVGWVAELANPDVPLHKISKSVPHGFKGHDLLDMLQNNRVAVNRAVWYVRVLGANETQGMRNRPNFHPAMYSIEWANVVTSYVKKLLAEIALPSAPRAALNIKQTFKSILADGDSRDKWVARFTYLLDLLREFYAEGLVDHCTFLSCLAQQMVVSNLAQAGFVACLLEDYFEGLLSHRVFARPFLEGCLGKLAEIEGSPVKEHLAFLAAVIKGIMQRALPIVPDAFVGPSLWMPHSSLLRDLFRNRDDFADVERRNEALTFRALPARAMARVRMMMAEIHALNAVTMDTDLSALARRRTPLALLLTWAASPAQHGVHRPFLVATLLARRAEPDVQDALVEWLEDGDAAQSARGAARLMGELARAGLFSYERFLQRTLARGEADRHSATLRETPVWKADGVVLRQRKIALYGIRAGARETEEDHVQRAIRAEIRQELPYLFGGALPEVEPEGTLKSRMPTLFGAHKFEQVRTVAQWLVPIAMEKLHNCTFTDAAAILHNYSVLSEILAMTQCFSCLCDLNIALLQQVTAPELLMAVVSNLRRFAFIFKCMDVLPALDQALAIAHSSIRSRPAQLRSLLALLQVLNRGEPHESSTLQLVAVDVDASVQALRPPLSSPEDMPSLDLELWQLALDPATNAPSILAHSLWSKFKTKANWGLAAAESTFASLRQFTSDTMPQQPPPDTAGKFASFLWEVDQLLAGDLDAHLLECFRGPVFVSGEEMRVADEATWSIVASIVVELVARGCVSTQTILRGIVYPAWSLGAQAADSEEQVALYEPFLLASVKLGLNLLICAVNPDEDIPPRGLAESQQLKARRAMLYDDGDFAEFVTSLRSLVAWEASDNERLKDAACALRTALQINREFWFIARKNLDLVRDVFLTVLPPSEPLVEMLRSILGDPTNASDHEEEVATTDWQNISSRVNPWTFARTSINLHLTLQELVKGLGEEDTRAQAERNLDTFTAGLFDSAVTAEETDLLADVLRGISGPVVAKFVNNGIRRLTSLLEECTAHDYSPDVVEPYLRRAGEVLRLLAGVIVPLRDDPAKIPIVEAEVQDKFVGALYKKLMLVESKLPHVRQATDSMLQLIIFLARMLQFSLGLGRPWSDQLKESGSELMACLVRLSAACAGGLLTDERTFTILLDTVSIMVDDFPKDPKTAATDLFRNIPDVQLAQLSDAIPDSLRRRLLFILPYRSTNRYTDDLVYVTPEAQDGLSYGGAVQHRPWEWIESIEARDSPTLDEHGEPVVVNATSIPLDLFAARPTAERVYAPPPAGGARPGDLMLQQDTLASGSVFEHDWRQSRVPAGPDEPAAHDGEEHGEQDAAPDHAQPDPFQHEPSPAPTALSRTSAFAASASGSSRRGSPAVQHATMSSSRGSKRKASTTSSAIEIDDDEAEPVRAPPKRGRGRPPAPSTRARGKKK